MNRPDPSDTPREVFAARRQAVHQALDGGVMVLPAAPVQYSSRDGERSYHPDRELYYVTGATEPGTTAVLTGGEEPRTILFVRDRDAEAELWSGERLGVDGSNERFSPDECHPLSELPARLPELLDQGRTIHYRLGRSDALEGMVLEALHRARSRGPRTGTGPRGILDPGEILDDLRLLKDAYEVETIRRAVEITLAGHRAAAGAIAPGVGEWVVEGALDGTFRSMGGAGPAFETIVGSGRNACVLHYVANRGVIGTDQPVLVDAGAEYGLYAGDVTRTFPSGGRFTGPQREVYQLVDAARRAAVATIAPGVTVADVHDAAARVLAEGLTALGVLEGTADEILEREGHKAYYPHRTSHWLGLDVHDPGDYALGGLPRTLQPGMVLTVEPGLYFRQDAAEVGTFSGIGVRIEDDVLVTDSGHEVLTAALPTEIGEVEALTGASR